MRYESSRLIRASADPCLFTVSYLSSRSGTRYLTCLEWFVMPPISDDHCCIVVECMYTPHVLLAGTKEMLKTRWIGQLDSTVGYLREFCPPQDMNLGGVEKSDMIAGLGHIIMPPRYTSVLELPVHTLTPSEHALIVLTCFSCNG
jgi:hypothetical protein